MKRTLRYALAATAGATLAGPGLAQDMFPDTPDNHWAYEALLGLKRDGLLVGYPDALFRGNRPTSRYELAVAAHAAYMRLKTLAGGLETQIQALTDRLDGKGDKTDVEGLRRTLAALSQDVAHLKAWGSEIGDLKRLATTFEKEIASLGVDAAAMKRDLVDLSNRLDAIERMRPPIDIHGTLDVVGMAAYAGRNLPGLTGDRYGIGVDGTRLGVGRDGYDEQAVGMARDLSILREGALTFQTTRETGPKWRATLVVGNALSDGAGFGNQSQTLDGRPFREGGENVYLQDFDVSFDTAMAGQSFFFQAGRFGYQMGPYLMKRPDTTPYFANDRWDNGDWMVDGLLIRAPIGWATFELFAGRNSDATSAGAVPVGIQPMQVGKNTVPVYLDGSDRPRGLTSGNNLGMPVDSSLGVKASVKVGKNGMANFAYLWLLSDAQRDVNGVGVNRMEVLGGDFSYKLDKITLSGGYSQSNLNRNSHKVVDRDNSAAWARAAFDCEGWGVAVGYRRILPLFAAPGDWGRIGIWWNPTDIEGFDVGAHAKLGENLKIAASGEFYRGTNNGDLDGTTPDRLGFGSRDRVDRYVVGLDYRFRRDWVLSLGYETVLWNLKSRADPFFVGGKPVERWYNIGLGYTLSDVAKLNILWQISDYDSKGVPGFGPFAANTPGDPDRASGGLVTTQLSVRF